jgi:endonuclease/exonuclease/phosphatase family metal-dependent hydrolase
MAHVINRILGKRGLEILVLILLVLRVLAYFGAYTWFADMLANYAFQYLFWGFTLGTIMARLKSWIYCGIAFMVAAVSLVQVAGSTIHVSSVYIPKPSFTIMQYNTQYTNSRYNDVRLWLFDHRDDIDMAVLQEATPGLAYQTRTLSPFFPSQIEDTQTDDSGTIILSKHPFDTKEMFEIKYGKTLVRAYHVTMQPPNFTKSVSVYILHAASDAGPYDAAARAYEFGAMIPKIIADQSPHIIFTGDWGLTPYYTLYKQIVMQTGLFEQRKTLFPAPTWPSYGAPWIMQIPVDHVLTDKSLTLNLKYRGDAMGSDHIPVIASYTE